MMLYGFIVAAFLVIQFDDQAQQIPFASMSACRMAEIVIRDTYTKREQEFINCVATGA